MSYLYQDEEKQMVVYSIGYGKGIGIPIENTFADTPKPILLDLDWGWGEGIKTVSFNAVLRNPIVMNMPDILPKKVSNDQKIETLEKRLQQVSEEEIELRKELEELQKT